MDGVANEVLNEVTADELAAAFDVKATIDVRGVYRLGDRIATLPIHSHRRWVEAGWELAELEPGAAESIKAALTDAQFRPQSTAVLRRVWEPYR